MASKTVESVAATPRTGTFNKNHARRVRVQGLIPAVVYGAGQESMAITVDPKVITKILYSESGHNTIFDLAIEGTGVTKAMIVDWQHEPIKGKLLHIDLKRIAMDKMMRVSVPVQLVGVPTGVKNSGGMLSQVLHEVEIECLPNDIPSHIDVDVTGLEVHGAIHVSDLPHNKSMKFLGDEHAMVAHVTLLKEEAAAEPVAGATEPEVAKKGKQDATADAGAAKK
ncbi:50S ribosomal protein L25 [Granulicella sp. 5B5]|uniref:50S ribosomal protein L25 n=1 Tax=Granulicella sp. 5B5 TaxID=1617967 RepID=UPI0015F51725|nr:50S ribosomal protein L25 [Granulicella sp. 5B5]QMV18639.1 50S ribosomal protein L25 [Granulicella sp. 5B5]